MRTIVMARAKAAIFASFLLAPQAGAGGAAQLLPYPPGENLVDAANKAVGRVADFNQVVVNVDGAFASLPFSIRGLLAGNGLDPKDYPAESLITYHPKRDCRGDPFIKSDTATVPYKAYPIGLERIGNSNFYRSVEYFAPVQSAFGDSKYMFSYKNLITGQCTEGTYFGIFLLARKLQLLTRPPLFLR